MFVSTDDPDVKGVIICTVTYTHEHFVKNCIQAKKAIFCEKPIAESRQDTGNGSCTLEKFLTRQKSSEVRVKSS